MARNLPPVKMVYPVLGLHEGVGYDIQPPGTTNDELNMSSFDAIKNRLRGGRRAGLSKYVEDLIDGGSLVQTMCRVGTAQSGAETRTTVTDDFSSGVYGTTGEGNIGGDYHRAGIVSGSGLSPAPEANSTGTSFDGTNDWVSFNRGESIASLVFAWLAIAYPTTNDITAIIRANGVSSSDNGGSGLTNQGTYIGPVIRANANLNEGVGARLIRVGANQVQLEIFSFVNAVITSLALSATQTLDGGASIVEDCSIRLHETSGSTVEAILNWPTQLITNLTVSTSTSVEGGRGGVLGTPPTRTGTIAAWRKLAVITYTKIVPASPTVLDVLQGADVNTTNGDRYFIPSGWKGVDLDYSTGVASPTPGFASSASDPAYVAVDGTANLVWESTSTITPTNTLRWIERTVGRSTKSLEVKPAAAGGGYPAAGYLMGADGRSGLFVYVNASGNTTIAANTGMYQATGANGRLRITLNGVTVHTQTGIFTSANPVIGHNTGYYRIQYNPINYRITVSVNGIVMATYTLDAAAQAFVNQLTGTRSGFLFREAANILSSAGADVIRYVDTQGIVAPTNVQILAVADGTVKGVQDGVVFSVSGGAAALSSAMFNPMLQEAFGKVWMIDGATAKYYDKGNNLITAWTAVNGGTLPSLPRLIALYRGRIVLSGVVLDPHNWFMSKVGDPLNYDYSPTPTTKIQAVAGNNSQVGLCGDIITSLVPFGDDAMIIGGDHTIWQMTGDPAAGGSLDQISDKTGMAFGKAWATDPNGNLYFWGTAGGIFKMVLAGKPVNFSKGRIDRRLRGIDLNAHRIFMEWDYLREALVTLIVPSDTESDVRVIVWESRIGEEGAFHEWSYPQAVGPQCMLAYDGPDPEDQVLLFGCRDGYIRKVDEDAEDDDGTDITARFRYAPFLSQDGESDVKLTKLLPVLAAQSGVLTVNVYTGQSAEECMTATNPRVSRILRLAGRNPAMRQKVNGYTLQVEVERTGSGRWAMESMSATFSEGGMPRKVTTPDGD